ncbi:MAG: GNAT family N-acetyltransferase [Marinibacterium sp.]|nr:GNAT family N-acetyltransferase [Marinibacterium sp.]
MRDAPVPSDAAVHGHLSALLAPATPHRLAIAWDGDVPVGLAAVAVFTSVSDPRPARRYQMELKELFVLADRRGARIGQALLDWVEAKARAAGACRMDWNVKSDNARGIAFYQRHGAQVVDTRLSMRKVLPPQS